MSLSAGAKEGTDAADLEYLFREARLQGGIVSIDECESLCSKDSDELRCLLRELGQFDGVVIMATNQPQELVPQLDRRFTLKVPFATPSSAARERIWALHLGDVALAGDVDGAGQTWGRRRWLSSQHSHETMSRQASDARAGGPPELTTLRGPVCVHLRRRGPAAPPQPSRPSANTRIDG